MNNNNTNEITPFLFGETTIRTITLDGTPWFVASDACAVLGLGNSSQAISTLADLDEKGVTISDTPGGQQKIAIVNEPGLYRLIFKSRKAVAKAFQRWVFHEVLPTIRRTGSYSPANLAYVSLVRETIALGVSPDVAARYAARLTMAELEQRESAARRAASGLGVEGDPPPTGPTDADLILSVMRPGCAYRLHEIVSLLPAGHPYTTMTGRRLETSLGMQLASMARRGMLYRLPRTRYGTYTLPPSPAARSN
jgi:prophage antirepressor-like protein